MITDRDKIQLKNLLFTPQWKVVEMVATMLITDIQSRPKVGDSEWETVKKTVGAEGEEQGIKRLFQQIKEFSSQAK